MKRNYFLAMILSLSLMACANINNRDFVQGKTSFKNGNYPMAFNLLQQPAKAGLPEAQYALGYMYYYGRGVKSSVYLARYWIRKAALQKYPPAVKALAEIDNPVWTRRRL